MLSLGPDAPAGSNVKAIISSGDTIDDFEFEGIPDGIGFIDNGTTVDVFITHEQSRVPFPLAVASNPPVTNGVAGLRDFVDSSISRLTLSGGGKVLSASVPLSPAEGFIRFCSAFLAGPAEGFDDYVFFANEESDDDLAVPAGTTYTADPSLGTLREAGYAVYLDVESGEFAPIPGMGRHNHENTVIAPGGWDDVVALSGDDTFVAPASQLYLYKAATPADMLADAGALYAFRVTATQAGAVDPADPFNGANDYGDIEVGDEWKGEFIQVPADVAKGDLPPTAPQQGLEDWSNANNVFQFIRVEDIAYDDHEPNVVYFADTGERRAVADPRTTAEGGTDRLQRIDSAQGLYPNGRIFRMEFDPTDPTRC